MTAMRQPRALGDAMLRTKQRSGRTVIDSLRQSGALKLLFPHSAGAALQAVLVNTSGGVTGGDAFRTTASVAAGGTLTLTTQAAECAYRALEFQTGNIRTTLTVGASARLNWLPQETILFDGCALDRRLRVTLEPDARFLMCEPIVFGRLAMGESLLDAALRDRVEITRDGAPIYLDAVHLSGPLTEHLQQCAGGAVAMANLVFCAPDAENHLDWLRAALPLSGGASLIKSDILVMRLLAPDSFVLRQSLMPILARLSGAALPRPWIL